VWFLFAFPLWLEMVNIFSCVFWPFEFLEKFTLNPKIKMMYSTYIHIAISILIDVNVDR
jgi:hypothetical protein